MTPGAPTAELVAALGCRGLTVAVAESLTAGAVAAELGSIPGVSAVLRGGVVAYATDAKESVLGVPGEVLAAHGAVSQQTAVAMASSVARLFSADVGISTTGVAGPDPADGHPPGTVFVAWCGPSPWSDVALRYQLNGPRNVIRDTVVERVVGDVLAWVSATPASR